MRRNLALLLAGIVVASQPALRAETLAEQNARVEALLPQLRKRAVAFRRGFDTPGMALAVVTRDRVYPLVTGVCETGRARPIRATTLFQFASMSKPITSTFAAMLVSQGRLGWDSRIHDLLPWFRVAETRPTRLATIRDMLDLRGLPGPAGDFLEGLGLPQRTILDRMQFVSVAENFRKRWEYSNFGVTVGGVAAASVTGQPYPEALQRLLLRPAGMNTATAIYHRFGRTRDRAALHIIVDGKPVPAFVRPTDAQAPAGGVSGSILDIAAFLQLHLNRGVADGRQIVLPSALDACYRRYTDLGKGVRVGTDPRDHAYYGIGWDITVKPDGTEYINHNGAFSAGARTIVSFRRADSIGIVVLTNGFLTLLPEAVVDMFFQLYDTGHVRPGTLTTFRRRAATDGARTGVDTLISGLFGLVNAPAIIDGRPLDAYAGKYRNDFVGDFDVTESFDPESGHNALFFKATARRTNVKVQIIAENGQLAARTPEGGLIGLEFQNFDGTRFNELVIPNLAPLGWQNLARVR
ncbi:MAG TPA: serine hydrolase domain-containing protein [Chthoniobacterales bacterium]